MPVHKLYCDSRAAKEGTPSDWTWQPDRPLLIQKKSRAFVDAVHLPVTWGTITATNNQMYVTEELPFFTVLASADKVYLTEDLIGGSQQRVVTMTPAVYDGNGLAAHLSSVLSTGTHTYTATYNASATSPGTIDITVNPAITFHIASRASLLAASSWNGAPLVKTALEDASDVLGTVSATVNGSNIPATLSLGHGLAYRKISFDIGGYFSDTFATQIQDKLNAGTQLGTNSYTVAFSSTTGRLTVSNTSNPLTFRIFPIDYLKTHPYAFQGFTEPFYASDYATGLSGTAPLVGPSVTATHHINVQAHHTLFINSTLGMHSDSYGPVGQTTIARKVVCDQPAGGMIHDYHGQIHDYITLEPQSLDSVRFRVTDWQGHTVDMSHWSLSIIIIPEANF